MRRSGPLQRKTPLRRSPSPATGTAPERAAAKRRRRQTKRATDAYYRAEKQARLESAGFRCEIRVRCAGSVVGTTHHVKTRARDKRRDEMGRRVADRRTNLVAVCGPCHRHVHEHPEWAERVGWLDPSWKEDRT